jgi:hypothetical protein
MQEMVFQWPKFYQIWAHAQTSNSCLRHSAHTCDRILSSGDGKGKWAAIWQFFPTTDESLKNALDLVCRIYNLLSI